MQRTPLVLGSVVAWSVACGNPPAPLPEQRLCEPGQSTADWIDARLAESPAETVFDGLVLRAPTVVCPAGRGEEQIDLTFVEVLRLEVDGQTVQRSEDWLEKGSRPKMDPRATSFHVRRTESEPPLEWVFTGRRPR